MKVHIWQCTAELVKEAIDRQDEGNEHADFKQLLDGMKVRVKFEYFLRSFKQDVDRINTTGSEAEIRFPYFEELFGITKDDPNVRSKFTVDSSNMQDESQPTFYRRLDDDAIYRRIDDDTIEAPNRRRCFDYVHCH